MYDKYWINRDTTAISTSSFFKMQRISHYNQHYILYMHDVFRAESFLQSIIHSNVKDSLDIIFIDTPNYYGIAYWKTGDFKNIFYVSHENIVNKSYTTENITPQEGIPNNMIVKSFFDNFTYRDNNSVLHTTMTFNEWIKYKRKYPITGQDSFFTYVKIHIPKNYKEFKIIDLISFSS